MSDLGEHGPCPKCGSDWKGQAIPEEMQHQHYGGRTHYSRRIGIEITSEYDGVAIWRCPDCGYMHDRFTQKEVTAEEYAARCMRCPRCRPSDETIKRAETEGWKKVTDEMFERNQAAWTKQVATAEREAAERASWNEAIEESLEKYSEAWKRLADM